MDNTGPEGLQKLLVAFLLCVFIFMKVMYCEEVKFGSNLSTFLITEQTLIKFVTDSYTESCISE